MKRILLSFLFLIFSLNPYLYAENKSSEIKLKNLKGEEFILGSHKDKEPLVLIFWNTRCPFCIQELIWLQGRYNKFIEDKCKIVAINLGESVWTIKHFLKKIPLDFEIVVDPYLESAYLYNLRGVPTYIFINKKGDIVFKGHKFDLNKYNQLILKDASTK